MPAIESQEHNSPGSGGEASGMNASNQNEVVRGVKGDKSKRNIFLHLGRYQGIFYALLSATGWVIQGSVFKTLNEYPVIGIVFYPSLFASSISLPIVVSNVKSFPKITKKLLLLWTVLILSQVLTQIFKVLAYQMLPIGEASSICFSTPIFTAMFARLILKDRLTRMTMIALFLSVVGMLLTMRLPEMITSGEERLGSIQHLTGCLYAFGSVLTISATFIVMRDLRDTSSTLNTFIQQFGRCIIMACLSPVTGGFLIPQCEVIINVKLISLGILSFLIIVLLNLAMQNDDPTTVGTVYRSTEVILSFLVQLTIFKDSIDAYSISGAIVIFACGLLMPLQKWMQGQKEGNAWRESWLIK